MLSDFIPVYLNFAYRLFTPTCTSDAGPEQSLVLFILVDLQDFFFRFRVRERKKKALELTVNWSFSELFFFHFQSFFLKYFLL